MVFTKLLSVCLRDALFSSLVDSMMCKSNVHLMKKGKKSKLGLVRTSGSLSSQRY